MINLDKKQFSIDFAGKKLTLEVSRIGEQANAAVIGTYGDTTVLVTAVMGKEDKSVDYLPLVLDYEERFYAAGKIIGSRFVRREGRPSEEAILSGRLIDRTLRPLFDQRGRRDIQVTITILSYDEENDPDFIGLLTASAALAISDIPWNGPVGGVKTAVLKDGKIIINPLNSEIKEGRAISLEGFFAGTSDKINMIELAGNEAKEDEVVEAAKQSQEEIKKLIDFQKNIIKEIGKPKTIIEYETNDILKDKIQKFLKDKLEAAIYISGKTERLNNLGLLKKDLYKYLAEEGETDLKMVDLLFEDEINDLVHKNILEKEKRPDGRKLDELRDLYAEVGLFKRLHGSGLFMRGNTQALAVATLAAPGAEQLVETMEISTKRRFMLHYNFPPFCTGEIGRLGAPGRREIGHGALAEKAFRYLIPSKEEFPYTIRVVSEVLSSNGSSSMATVCASSLALMDAGVPIKKPAAGIAMGLMMESADHYKVLTDIQGPEDHHGDMDCKIAGTNDGVTAMQMDVKIQGIDPKILKDVLMQSKKARLEILDFMKNAINEPRKQLSSFAPSVITIDIKPDQIGAVIGPGGKIINGIIADTGALSIDIEQTGKVFVAATDRAKAEAAIEQIKSLTHEFQIGEIIEGEIIKILDFGAILDLGGGKDGMIHISELKNGFVEKVEDVVKLGDRVRAKIVKIDPSGKIGLSLKAMRE